jgi:membrane protein DedA with SNARE-associated domain
MAAGYTGMRWAPVAGWCLLGNLLWIGGMGGTAWWLGEALQESHRAVKIATGVAGLAVAWVSLRHVERRLPAA